MIAWILWTLGSCCFPSSDSCVRSYCLRALSSLVAGRNVHTLSRGVCASFFVFLIPEVCYSSAQCDVQTNCSLWAFGRVSLQAPGFSFPSLSGCCTSRWWLWPRGGTCWGWGTGPCWGRSLSTMTVVFQSWVACACLFPLHALLFFFLFFFLMLYLFEGQPNRERERQRKRDLHPVV